MNLKDITKKLYESNKNSELIFIGEIHNNPKIIERIINYLKIFRPDIILLEALNDVSLEEGEKIKQMFESISINEIIMKTSRKYKINPDKILEEVFGSFIRNYNSEKYKTSLPDFYIPKNSEELINATLYKLPFDLVLDIYIYLIEKDNKDATIFTEIKEKINFFKNLLLDSLLHPWIVHYCDVFRTAYEIEAKIGGCDPSERKKLIISGAKDFLEVVNYIINERLKEDEVKMAKRIIEVKERYKPNKIVVIVGNKHLRKDSYLLREIKKYNIKYRVYRPKFKTDIADSIIYNILLFSKSKYFENFFGK